MYDESLVTDNLKLIGLSIKQMHLICRSDDEFQEYYDAGLDGLIQGSKTYNSSLGMPSTYLVACIKNSIKRLLSKKTLKKNKNIYGDDISLNINITKDDDKFTLEDTLADTNIDIEKQIENKLMYETVIKKIDYLNIRERKCIKYYFGLIDGNCYSYKQIGEKLNISHEAVRLIVNRAIKKLRLIVNKSEIKQDLIGGNMSRNLGNLNDYLFEELERLNNTEIIDDDNKLKKEIERSKAISSIATNVINNANVVVEVNKLFNKTDKIPDLLGIPSKK